MILSDDEVREIRGEIYEYGEIERDAARTRQFIPNVWPFRWMIRLLEWTEVSAARERDYLRGFLHRHYNFKEGDRYGQD